MEFFPLKWFLVYLDTISGSRDIRRRIILNRWLFLSSSIIRIVSSVKYRTRINEILAPGENVNHLFVV